MRTTMMGGGGDVDVDGMRSCGGERTGDFVHGKTWSTDWSTRCDMHWALVWLALVVTCISMHVWCTVYTLYTHTHGAPRVGTRYKVQGTPTSNCIHAMATPVCWCSPG